MKKNLKNIKLYSLNFNSNCKLVERLGLTYAIFLYYIIHEGSHANIAMLYGIVLFGVPETVIQLIHGTVAFVNVFIIVKKTYPTHNPKGKNNFFIK